MTGRTLDEAVVLLLMLENAAEILLKAMGAGTLAPEFPAEDVAALREKLLAPDQFTANFEYLVRTLK